MNNDHLSKAKKWINSSVRATTLTILPLAAVAVSEAALVLPSTGTWSDPSGSGISPPQGTFAQLAESDGIQGTRVELTQAFTTGTDYMFIIAEFNPVTIDDTSTTISVPFSWSLDLSFDPETHFSFWAHALEVHFQSSSYTYPSSTIVTVAAENGLQQGSGTIDLQLNGDPGELSGFISLELWAPSASGPMTVNSFSVSLNPNSLSAVPEPSSLIMLSGTAGLLAFYRRRSHA